MKVVATCPYFSPEYGTYEMFLGVGIAKIGHEFILYTSDRKQKRYYKGEHLEEGYDIVCPSFTVTYIHSNFDLIEMPYMRSLPAMLKGENDGDIFHSLDEFYQFCSKSLFKVAKKLKKPFIFTQHRYYKPRRRWLKFIFGFYESVSRKIALGADRIIAISRDAKDYLVNQGISKEKIEIIPLGVDYERFATKLKTNWARLEEGEPIILTVARLHPNKGLPYLIHAMKTVVADYPKAKLIIHGKGPEETSLLHLINKMSLADNVFIDKGYIPHSYLPSIYRNCDIFVLPSLFEPFGVVVLEAMSSGMPVIGTTIGGIKDVILPNINGLLVPPADSEALSTAILAIIQNPKSAREMAKRAKMNAQQYSWERIVKRTLELYEECLWK